MSDLDDLLDDMDKVEVVNHRKTTMFTGKGKLKAAVKKAEVKVQPVEDDVFDDNADLFEDEGGLMAAATKDSTKSSLASKGKILKKKVDKTKINEKIFGTKEKKTGLEKKKFQSVAESLENDPFFQPKIPPKVEEPEKIEPAIIPPVQNLSQNSSPVKESSQVILEAPIIQNEQQQQSSQADLSPEKPQENKNRGSIEHHHHAENTSSSIVINAAENNAIAPTLTIIESERIPHNNNSAQESFVEQQPSVVSTTDTEQRHVENGLAIENNSNIASANPSFLTVDTGAGWGAEPRKSFEGGARRNEIIQEIVVEKPEESLNLRLDLDLLQSKAGSSLLKGRDSEDVFVPGNQRIIRKRKDKNEGKKQAQIRAEPTTIRRIQANQSMIHLTEGFVEKFEKEDYEAARPLGVDEFIKNFMVSENSLAENYTVPLTRLYIQPLIASFFQPNAFGQATASGKPRSIKRISSAVILVGTSQGAVYGFDTKRNLLLFKLGDTKESTYGSVTAMDYEENSKYLVSGYESGKLVVFDTTKRNAIKVFDKAHEAAIIALEIISVEPLQYLSVDTAGVVQLNELERMMMIYNQQSYCIFSQSSGLNFVQLDILNHRYPNFMKINKQGEPELIIAYSATQQIVITTLEPITKTKRVLLKYPRPPIVYEGAIPHVIWYERQPLTQISTGDKDSYFDDGRIKYPSQGGATAGVKEIFESRYWMLMGWGFCLFLIEMRITNNDQVDFEEIGYIKFGAEVIHLQLIDKQVLMIMDASGFIHLIPMDDIKNNQDFYLPSGNRAEKRDEVGMYSERLNIGDMSEIAYQTSFYFKEDGKFKKVYHNTLKTDLEERETLIVHNKGIFCLKLNSWRDLLDDIEAQKNWLKLFTISLALYHNNIKEVEQSFPEKQRQEILREHFKDKLRRFVTSQIMGRQATSSSDPAWSCFVEEVTLTLIDFCLEAKMEDFLFTDAKLCMETFGFKDTFFKSLEPFIRWNKIHLFPNLQVLKEVIDFFLSKGKVSVTQQLIASLDLERWNEDDREMFLLSLMTIILEKNLFTALPYVCVKGTQNFTLPFFTFLNLAAEADRKGDPAKQKEYILRCLWFIKTIFKRKVAFMDELISEEKTKEILKDLVLLLMEESHLEKFYNVEPVLTTVLIGMLFTGELSLFLEDFYGQIPLCETANAEPALKNNLHFQMLNRVNKFYEKYFGKTQEQERKRSAYFAFILAKVVEEQKHKFLAEHLCKDSAKYFMKHHHELDDLMIMDFKINPESVENEVTLTRVGAVTDIPEDLLVERKGTMIERMLIYATNLLNDHDILNEMIPLATIAEPYCYLMSMKQDWDKCLVKYLDHYTPHKTKRKAIQWVLTTTKQKIANRDEGLDRFKKSVLDKVGQLVLIDPEKMTNFIKAYFKKDEIKTAINKLSNTPQVQLVFVESFINEAKSMQQLDDEVVEIYIKLLAESGVKANKKKILKELQRLGRYPPKCIEVCEKVRVKDAWAYLEEMKGNREGIRKAIDLRFELLQEKLMKFIRKNQYKMTPRQEDKLRDKFNAVSMTIKNHLPDNHELWFEILENVLRMEMPIMSIDFPPKRDAYQEVFEETLEKTFVDEMLECISFEIILSELDDRAARIPPLTSKKFLTKMLRENYFEEKFSVDALNTQKSEVTSIMNVNLIPYEVKGISSAARCAFCERDFEEEGALVFNCGHTYHARHSSKPDNHTCEICCTIDAVIATKIFEAKLKKLYNQPQARQEEFSHRERSGLRTSHRMPRRESLVNNDSNLLKNIRIESRLNAIERSKASLADEVSDMVSSYRILEL